MTTDTEKLLTAMNLKIEELPLSKADQIKAYMNKSTMSNLTVSIEPIVGFYKSITGTPFATKVKLCATRTLDASVFNMMVDSFDSRKCLAESIAEDLLESLKNELAHKIREYLNEQSTK